MSLLELRREPYRLLFPLGLLQAGIGIGVWILYYLWPDVIPYPGTAHAIIQLQGFLLCFGLGFLTTMLPKVLGLQPLGTLQLVLFPIGLVAISICSWVNLPHTQLAVQGLHLFLLANFIFFIARRWSQKTGNPPGEFQFIALAVLSDIAGTVIRILSLSDVLDAGWFRLATLLQYQAFPLLLIMGIGGFLLPKLFGNAVVDPRLLRASIANPKLIDGMLALLFLLGMVIEGIGYRWMPGLLAVRLGCALRSIVWIRFLVVKLRLHTVAWKLPAYLMGVRYSLIAMAVGMLAPIAFPVYLLAWEHITFIAGILWLTLSVASRVISAHGGRLDILQNHRKKTVALGILLVLAMSTRASTDIFIRGRWLHLAAAAAFALAALYLWGRIYLPLINAFPGRPSK